MAAGNPIRPGWPHTTGPLQVRAGVVRLRPPKLFDGAAWSRARIRDESALRPWEPTVEGPWAARHQPGSWPQLYFQLRAAGRRGLMLPFVIELDGEFAGQITIGNVVRGALRSAWIGYWVATPATGGGVATAAVALALDHAFGPAGLHRVEATVKPDNLPSRAVLARAGMRPEGTLQRYLHIDGAWADHLLVAMTSDEVPGSVAAALVSSGRAKWC